MALVLSTTYSGKIDTTSDPTGYPQGKPQNVTTPGDNTGTPWDEDIASDIVGFLQALLSAAGTTPSGNPDKVGASDYLNSLRRIAGPNHVSVESDSTASGTIATATSTTTNIAASGTHLKATVYFASANSAGGVATFIKPAGGTTFISAGQAQNVAGGGDPTDAEEGTTTLILDTDDGANGQFIRLTATRNSDSDIDFSVEGFTDVPPTSPSTSDYSISVILEAYI